MCTKWNASLIKKPEQHFCGRNLKFSMTCSTRRSHSGQKQNAVDKKLIELLKKSMRARIGEAEQQVESRREQRDGNKMFWW